LTCRFTFNVAGSFFDTSPSFHVMISLARLVGGDQRKTGDGDAIHKTRPLFSSLCVVLEVSLREAWEGLGKGFVLTTFLKSLLVKDMTRLEGNIPSAMMEVET
jgi:hypothetical protein